LRETEREISTIIETDPVSLYARVVEQWTVTCLYKLLLESAAAEHAARYELMGAATQHADRLIEELTLAIQTTRQRAITQEMQELAAGAGMVGTRSH
jgi:F-type H+-transporting ATPase subunit gamma